MTRNPDVPCVKCGKLCWLSKRRTGGSRDTKRRDLLIYELRERGLTYCEVAKEVNMSTAGVHRAMTRIMAGGLGQGVEPGRLIENPYRGKPHICLDCRRAERRMTCAGCGTTFQTTRWLMSKNKTGTYYCSTDCHMAATMRANHSCDYCGSAYRDQNSGRTRYCSLECSRWARTRIISTELTWKQCPTCDGWLCNPHRTYCSKACWKKPEQKPWRKNTSCKDCGVPLPDQAWIRRCEPCRIALAEKMRRKHQRLAGCKNARQRARHHGVEYEYINRRKVFIRDGWRCGICRKKVDKRLKYPHPMSVSLDHIVPMSLGGGHLYENVQCSHWLCNTEKCDTGAGDQLALLG